MTLGYLGGDHVGSTTVVDADSNDLTCRPRIGLDVTTDFNIQGDCFTVEVQALQLFLGTNDELVLTLDQRHLSRAVDLSLLQCLL